jgi:hypothetical protein
MSPSEKPDRSRHGSRESKKLVEGKEGVLGKEGLTPKDQQPEDPKRQAKKEKKPVSEEDAGEGGVIVECLCNLVSPPKASLLFPVRVVIPE